MADIVPSPRCGHWKHIGSCVGDSSRNMVALAVRGHVLQKIVEVEIHF